MVSLWGAGCDSSPSGPRPASKPGAGDEAPAPPARPLPPAEPSAAAQPERAAPAPAEPMVAAARTAAQVHDERGATATPPAPPSAPAVARPQPPAAPAGGTAIAHFRSNPTGAQVARATDGEPLGTTPFELSLPDSQEPLVLLFWKKGYAPKEMQVVPHGDVTLNVQLSPVHSSSGSKKKTATSAVDKRTTIDPFN